MFVLDLLVNYTNGQNEGGMSTKGRGLSKLADLVSIAFNENVSQEDLETLYKVGIQFSTNIYFLLEENCQSVNR